MRREQILNHVTSHTCDTHNSDETKRCQHYHILNQCRSDFLYNEHDVGRRRNGQLILMTDQVYPF
jgi:hypothetical protein